MRHNAKERSELTLELIELLFQDVSLQDKVFLLWQCSGQMTLFQLYKP